MQYIEGKGNESEKTKREGGSQPRFWALMTPTGYTAVRDGELPG